MDSFYSLEKRLEWINLQKSCHCSLGFFLNKCFNKFGGRTAATASLDVPANERFGMKELFKRGGGSDIHKQENKFRWHAVRRVTSGSPASAISAAFLRVMCPFLFRFFPLCPPFLFLFLSTRFRAVVRTS